MNIWLYAGVAAHLIGGHPARVVELSLNLLTAHLLGNVRYADPKHANRKRVLARAVVHCNLDFVCLVNVELVRFVRPAIIPGRLGAALDAILDLDVNKGFWPTAESASCCMIDVRNCVDTQREVAAQRLSLAGDVQTVVYRESVDAVGSLQVAYRLGRLQCQCQHEDPHIVLGTA